MAESVRVADPERWARLVEKIAGIIVVAAGIVAFVLLLAAVSDIRKMRIELAGAAALVVIQALWILGLTHVLTSIARNVHQITQRSSTTAERQER